MKKVREGYKMTELGEIPLEWKVKKLEDVFEVCQYGISDSLSDEGIYPVLRMNNIRNGKANLDDLKFINLDEDEFHKYSLNRNDILFNRTNSIDLVGKTGIYDSDELATFASYLIRIKTNEIAQSKFVNYYMNSNKGQERIRVFATLGVSQANINADNLKKVLIPIAPLKEQEKISLILSSLDEQIEITDNLIEKTKELKKGLMQKLLTKGIGHSRFKDTEIGRIPEEWEVVRIKDVADTTSGGTPSRTHKEYYENGTILWAKTGELNKKYIFNSEEKITEEAVLKSSAKLIPINSVLIAMYGATIGKTSISKKELTTNQACCAIICNEEVLNYEFLYYILNFNRNTLIELGAGGAQPNISQMIIKEYKIAVPQIKEQQKIASTLSAMDEQINQYESKKGKLQELKKGLMQKLLTGRIRVKV